MSSSHANLATPRAMLASFALVLSLASSCARADDLTGLPVDDPKDLSPAPAPQQTYAPSANGFVSMPSWSKSVVMPPLPEQLKPMGKKSLAASASGPTPAVVQPVKQADIAPTTVAADGTATGKPAQNDQAMITVSPFLQWIKANPQVAAEQARQQAAAYHGGAGAGSPPMTGPGASAPSTDDNYWLPPLIDSSDINAGPVGGSAAIYTKPQR